MSAPGSSARRCGYADRNEAYREVAEGLLAAPPTEGVAELRALVSARLDRLLMAVWPQAQMGSLDAVRKVLSIEHERGSLGLDSPPPEPAEPADWQAMAASGAVSRDEKLAVALAGGAKVAAAAKLAGLSQRTCFRRLRDPKFCALVAQFRSELRERAVGLLAGASSEAVATLQALTRSRSEGIRLRAAAAILTASLAARESEVVEQRLARLEEVLEAYEDAGKD